MNLKYASPVMYFESTLADVGSLSLELKYLSHITKDLKYRNAADRINDFLAEKTRKAKGKFLQRSIE